MPTDQTPDDLERIGREHAKRLGVEIEDNGDLGCWWNDENMPSIIQDANYTNHIHDNQEDAYRDLGRAVVACELACGLDDRVRAAVEAERESCAKVAENHRAVDKYREQYGWPHAQREIADAIRGRKGQ